GPFLVLGDRTRYLIAVIYGVELDLGAADAAVLVDPRIGVRDTLSERRSDVRGRTRIVGEMPQRDRRLGRCRGATEQQSERGCAQQSLHRHGHSPPVT